MAAIIQRGANCRLKFKITNDIDLTTLGEPVVALAQDFTFLTPATEQITVDNVNKCVYVDLDENDTMSLAENAKTQVQLAFANEDTGNVIRFPVHDVSVGATLLDSLL